MYKYIYMYMYMDIFEHVDWYPIGKDNNDHPTLKTTGCSLSVGSLSVKFHGGASWLYNLFSGSIANSVKKSMQGQVGQRSKVK